MPVDSGVFEKNYRLQDIQLSKNPERVRHVAAAFQCNSFMSRGPSSARQPQFTRLLAGVSEGWWRIPGSNR